MTWEALAYAYHEDHVIAKRKTEPEAKNGSIQHALRRQKLKAGSTLQTRDKEMLMPKTGLEETEELVHSTHEQQIRIRAYEIYLQRGGQPGNELEDWLQAERELTSK